MGTVLVQRREKTDELLDSAMSTTKVLPKDNHMKVLDFSVELLKNDGDNPFKPKSEEELYASIDRGMAQIKNGEVQDALDALDEIVAELEG